MKIIFLGTPPYVQCIREELGKHFTLVDSLKGVDPANGGADLAVVASYGEILTREQLETPKYGCINVHPSLLPKYRGPSPMQTAILNGDKISGLTIIKMDEEIDHGPIIYQEKIELTDTDNFDSLREKVFGRAAEILPQLIKDFIEQKLEIKVQDHSKATYCERLERESGYFDINNPPSPERLDRMIRAYYPWPGVWTKWRQQAGGNRQQQKIVKFLPEGKMQMEGKRSVSKKDFLNGYPDFPLK